VLELLDEIRQRLNLAVLSSPTTCASPPDLRLRRRESKGRVVNMARPNRLGSPRDDYTKALFAAAPAANWEFGKFAAGLI